MSKLWQAPVNKQNLTEKNALYKYLDMNLFIYKLYLMRDNIILGCFVHFVSFSIPCNHQNFVFVSFTIILYIVQDYYQKNLKHFWSKWCMLKIVFRMCFVTFTLSIKFSDSKYILILMSSGSCSPNSFLQPENEFCEQIKLVTKLDKYQKSHFCWH